jgi:polygalacturonase
MSVNVPAGGAAPVNAGGKGAAQQVFDVRGPPFQAKGDGKTNDAAAIQAAVDAANKAGGGVVLLKGGTFLSGSIQLRSNVTLRIDKTATLKGTQNDADYPPHVPNTPNTQLSNCKRALIYAEGATNVRIDGGGTIDGNGSAPQWNTATVVEAERPMVIWTAQCNGVHLSGVNVKNSAMWSVVSMEDDNVFIDKLTVNSTQGRTRDGIDIVDSHNVKLTNSTVSSEDDSICLKSGSPRGVANVTVKNCTILHSGVANGLKFGTASYGSLTNILFDGIKINNVPQAAMALEAVDGSKISNVTFRNIQLNKVGMPVFLLVGNRGDTPKGSPKQIGSINGVNFTNITGSAFQNWGSMISGARIPDPVTGVSRLYPVQNVQFNHVRLAVPGGMSTPTAPPPEYDNKYPDAKNFGPTSAYGFQVRHAQNVTFNDVQVSASKKDVRPEIVQQDIAPAGTSPAPAGVAKP